MSRKQQQKDDSSNNNTIPAKRLKAIFRHEADEELNGKQSYHKSHHITDYQCRHIIHDNLRSAIQKEFQHLIHRSCKHRGNSQEERELGRSLTRHLLCHTADNRCHGTGHARYHRNTLEQTDKPYLRRNT